MYRFSYPLRREYPYKWLTPLVAVGVLIAIASVLFVNIITQSYQLVATTTNDIRALRAEHHSNSFFSILRRNTNVSCDYTSLPVNSEIFTRNYALPYTIRKVWQQYDNGTIENLGALPYREHALNDCNVTSVGITVNGKFSQGPLLNARSRVGLDIKPQAMCAIKVETPKQKNTNTYFILEGAYNLIDDRPHFLLRNRTSSASLFWGESLLSLYYLVTSHAYYNASLSRPWGDPNNMYSAYTYSAFINLTRQSTASVGGPDEVISDDFFQIYCTTENNLCLNTTIPSLSQGGGTGVGHYGSPYPTIWPGVNILGKAMWFTAMTDLGQKDITVPNMLADQNLLVNLTSNLTNEVNAWLEVQNSSDDRGSTSTLDMSLATTTFDPSVTPAPALGVHTSYFSTNYICQKPMLKPAGTRVIAILSSSLILLDTIWKVFWFVFNLIVSGRLERTENNVVGVPIAGDMSSGDLQGKAEQEAKTYVQVNQVERPLD
ncbi:hypothetical protein F5B22DRAFT_630844 [Xylaria bambusicola]|uniref:uncharacterized protein n=1 Tax=Xylaria bambusicola TaxID=326684 RepID=UPI00200857E4|nr:uncharacterized protein F5B22DRAFT_630844 [Xylaria bambusicola]KAI0503025.1 hypothetical protein F5B22DRAFT_630844 [Xylaria bambusicola]